MAACSPAWACASFPTLLLRANRASSSGPPLLLILKLVLCPLWGHTRTPWKGLLRSVVDKRLPSFSGAIPLHLTLTTPPPDPSWTPPCPLRPRMGQQTGWSGPCDAGSPSAPGSTHWARPRADRPAYSAPAAAAAATAHGTAAAAAAAAAGSRPSAWSSSRRCAAAAPPSQALPQQLQPPQHHQAPPQPPPQAQPQPQPWVSQARPSPGRCCTLQPQLKLVSSWAPRGRGPSPRPQGQVVAPLPRRDSPWHPHPRPPYAAQQRSVVLPPAAPVQCPFLFSGGTLSSKQLG